MVLLQSCDRRITHKSLDRKWGEKKNTWEINIKTDLKRYKMQWCGFSSSG